jgi:hypothetical protein
MYAFDFMITHLKQHFRLALPIIAGTSAVVFVVLLGGLITEIASVPDIPSAAVVQTLGDGADEFLALFGGAQQSFINWAHQHSSFAISIAIIATIFSALFAFRELSRWIRGPYDAFAFIKHAINRIKHCAGGVQPIIWGTVNDIKTNQPLPFATVVAVDSRGSVRATAVADVRGRYGFHVPLEHASEFGIARIEIRKSGYHARHVVPQEDISITPVRVHRADGEPKKLEKIATSVAFWAGIVSIPLVFCTAPPGALGVVIVAVFGGSAIVRAIGKTPQ